MKPTLTVQLIKIQTYQVSIEETKNANGEVHKCECIIVWDFNHSHDNTKV